MIMNLDLNDLFSKVLNQHGLRDAVDDKDVALGSPNFDLHDDDSALFESKLSKENIFFFMKN
jgi:hypothetical protein